MGIKLDSQHIFTIGEELSNNLKEAEIKTNADLYIYVTANELRKIDEDLFYRREHSKEEEFKPSDKELTVNFDNLRMIIQAKTEDGTTE